MSGSDEGAGVSSPRCPTCDQPVARIGNPARPFCSIRCKLIDLGTWLDEHFRLPGPAIAESHLEPGSSEETVGPDNELGTVRKA